jgi:hypothetical protein
MVIIAVSYKAASLNKRIAALQQLGHILIPTSSLETCRQAIEKSNYHLLLIGATVPGPDRQILASLSKTLHPESKIVSVERPGASPLGLADMHVPVGDETALILTVSSVISGDSESDTEQRRR